jgi:hypothetical protein
MDERMAEKIAERNAALFADLLLKKDEKDSGQLSLDFDSDSEEDAD